MRVSIRRNVVAAAGAVALLTGAVASASASTQTSTSTAGFLASTCLGVQYRGYSKTGTFTSTQHWNYNFA